MFAEQVMPIVRREMDEYLDHLYPRSNPIRNGNRGGFE